MTKIRFCLAFIIISKFGYSMESEAYLTSLMDCTLSKIFWNRQYYNDEDRKAFKKVITKYYTKQELKDLLNYLDIFYKKKMENLE